MKKYVFLMISLLLLSLGALGSLSFSTFGLKYQTAIIELQGHEFSVQIADTQRKQTKGLSQRQTLDPQQGMLFVYSEEQPLTFWMKDTLIPLDIVFFNKDGSFNSLHHSMRPCPTLKHATTQCTLYKSASPAQFALELKGGTVQSLTDSPQQLRLIVKRKTF